MKAALVILGLLAITFAAVVAQGFSRDADARTSDVFGKPPPVAANGEPDEDSLARWPAPPIGEMLSPLLAPFATPVSAMPGEVDVAARGESRATIGKSDEDYQTARLTLISGDAVRVRSDPDTDTPKAATVCLCRKDALVAARIFDACGTRWKLDRSTPDGGYRCVEGDERNTLVFGSRGGALAFAADVSPARVSIR
jgi:hypothetical protein